MKALALSLLLASGSLLGASAALAESAHSDAPETEDLGAAENTPPEPSEAPPETVGNVGNHAEAEGAYEPTQPFDKAERDRKPIKFGHGGQFGLRAAASFAYKVNFRTEKSPPCADGSAPEKKVCPFGVPPAIDLALSYGVLDALELFVWARLGLGPEKVTRTAPSRLLGAGLRIYTSPEDRFKIFLEPAAAVELAGSLDSNTTRNYAPDILAHVNVGGQFDFARYFGVYLSVGPEAAFVRGISLILGGSVGVQGRLP